MAINILNVPMISYRLIIFVSVTLLFGALGSNKSYAAVSFEPPIHHLFDRSTGVMTSADFDGDGDIDLVTVHNETTGTTYASEGIQINLNNGDGTYTLGNDVKFNEDPISITSADFDGDGDIDLATANSASDDISILLNDGTGSFTLDSKPEAGLVPGVIASADFDGDGDIDLAVTIYDLAATPEEFHGDADSAVVLYNNDGAGHFTPSTVLPILPQSQSGGIIATDLNGDFADDIVVNNGAIEIFLNNKDGTFSSSDVANLPGNYHSSIVQTDIDSDGDTDLLIPTSNNIDVVLNDGEGNFHYDKSISSSGSFIASDLDSDGDIDIATIGGILLQNNSGDFISQESFNLPWVIWSSPIVSNDLNGDGKPDIVIAYHNGETGGVAVFLQTTTHQNQPPILSPIGNQVINEGSTLTFDVLATDSDNNTLTYSATNLPVGATFNLDTHVFSWIPEYSDAGNYPDIEFSVMDDGTPMELDVELVTITVGDVNRAPLLTNPGPQEILEDESLVFSVTATDPDDDTVTITASNLPDGATFDGTTLNWTPTRIQEGVYTVSFIATDTGIPNESTLLEVVITVGNNPTPVEQAEIIIETVVAIDVSQNIENSYLANLQKVEQFILDGRVQAALNQLNAFIAKVQIDYQHGIITVQVRDSLNALAQKLIGDIGN